MTAAQRADRAPIAACYSSAAARHATGRPPINGDPTPREPWTIDGWKTNPQPAIVGAPKPEPEPEPEA
jgi:hypothetical protein